MLTASKVRTFLRIEEDELSDEDINNYIDHYSARILAEIGSAAQQDPNIQNNALFQDTILAGIACQLSRTDISIIHHPSKYKVGDTQEDFTNTSMGLYGSIPSWCDEYSSLLSSLAQQYHEIKNLQVVRRRGMSVRRKWRRDF